MKKYSQYVLLILLSAACTADEFTQLCPDIEYKILSFEETKIKIEEGDAVYTSIYLEDEKFPQEWSSQIFISNNNKERLEGNLHKFQIGDSLLLRVNNDYFPSQYYEFYPQFQLRIDSVLKKKGMKFKRFAARERLENVEIAQYLFSKGKTLDVYKRGVFELERSRLNALPSLKFGDPIVLHYKIHLLNGKLIDSTEDSGPMEFNVGQSGQVLPGTAKAISLCSYGDKIKVIVPSNLAFGAKGLKGIVPPFSPLIMEIECTRQKPKNLE